MIIEWQILDDNVAQQANHEPLSREQQTNYMILMQQREEENRQEIAKLTAEIKALKVQLLEHRSKSPYYMAGFSFSSPLAHNPRRPLQDAYLKNLIIQFDL